MRHGSIESRMKNLKITTFAFALLLTGSLAGCKKKDAGGASGGGVGVPECDDYLARMDACAKKNAGKGGEQLTKMADMMRKSWSEDVKKADMKAAMPGTCKSAIKDMAKQMPDCDWGVPAAPAGDTAGSAAAGSGDMAGSAAAGSGDTAGSAAAGSGSAAGSAAAGSGSAK